MTIKLAIVLLLWFGGVMAMVEFLAVESHRATCIRGSLHSMFAGCEVAVPLDVRRLP